jgi:hypothetical protein
MIEFHEDMNLKKFYSQWFGIGREMGSNIPLSFGVGQNGNPSGHRRYTNSFEEFLKFIDWTEQNKCACWSSMHPMREYGVPFGLEKIVYDFDYHLEKGELMTQEKKDKVKVYVQSFLDTIECDPMIIETYKGYHVIAFLKKTYEFQPSHIDLATDVFSYLALSVAGINKLYCDMTKEDKNRWLYLDWAVCQDIMRMDRVPLSVHEKSGLRCNILDENLKPTKVRNLEYFRVNGIREYEVRKAVEDVMGFRRNKAKREEERINNSEEKFDSQFTTGELRPCFVSRLKTGQMNHQQRLALLSEVYYSLDSKIREDEELVEEKLMEVCMQFADYNEVKSLSQVRWYLKRQKVPPYKCKTIRKYGWCLMEECPIYRIRKG